MVETAERQRSADRLVVAVEAGTPALPLAVRSRLRGDRLVPAGMRGRRKKLQDLFVDRKVARERRDAVPLVVDRDDRILWVAVRPWPRILGSRGLHKACYS